MSLKNILIISALITIFLKGAEAKVVATTNLLGDLVKKISGEKIISDSLMGEGVDPHLYRATAQDLAKLQRAEIILYQGLHLEGKMGEVLEALSKRKKVYAIAERLPKEKVISVDGVADPHVWFDPELWIACAEEVKNILSENYPAHKENFEKNFVEWAAQVRILHKEGKVKLAKVPKERRVIITSHDAFRYFGRAFEVEVRGIQGLSTDSEVGLREMDSVIELIRKRKIAAIFVESSVPPHAIHRVRDKSGAKLGGELYSDALGPHKGRTGTYTGMLQHNIDTVVGALK
jgi:manganese/zinc/iron transport system substrate-binding protein